ncbi:MAG: hypothetical protein E7099_08300 [Mediterranea massiliensis]|nr:hypothetical protein [Mediterranea massiliensis]
MWKLCGFCFSVGEKIDAFYGVKKVPIISSLGSATQFQKRNEYYEYVYSDEADLLRQELKYVQTPILIKIDSLKTIVDYILPNVSEEWEYARFLRFMRQ